jgi:CheY-like chemotaxis protein
MDQNLTTHSLKILLIEDEDSIAKPLTRLLKLAGHEVIWTVNGQAALDWLNENGPVSIILVDVMLPIVNGWEFRELKKDLPEPLKNIPLIFLSADNSSATKAKELGEIFMPKPINLNQLKVKLHEVAVPGVQ